MLFGKEAHTPTKLWLDDLRRAPDGWTWVKTVDEAIELLKRGAVEEVSLDNDLGAYEPEGYKVADWIEEAAVHGKLNRMKLYAHTRNTVARDRMEAAFRNAKRAWDEWDSL